MAGAGLSAVFAAALVGSGWIAGNGAYLVIAGNLPTFAASAHRLAFAACGWISTGAAVIAGQVCGVTMRDGYRSGFSFESI